MPKINPRVIPELPYKYSVFLGLISLKQKKIKQTYENS